jgi:hypothetical protein
MNINTTIKNHHFFSLPFKNQFQSLTTSVTLRKKRSEKNSENKNILKNSKKEKEK